MKYLILGDVHADYSPFARAVDFCESNDYHLISVGDLIDNGPDGDKVVSTMLELVQSGKATLVKGNHEHKIIRYLAGNDVILGPPNMVTIDQFNAPGGDIFKNQFEDLIKNYAQDYVRLDQHNYIAHAGMDPKFWEADYQGEEITKKMVNTMLFGQADYALQYEYRGQTYPHRIYDWVDCVPTGKRLFVGHDPAPLVQKPAFDNFQHEPEVHVNDNGGEVIFLDCGAGKGGNLFGAVLNIDTNIVEDIVNFSNEH